jgi:hypothetical protein
MCGAGAICRAFLSVTNWFITASIPAFFTGSASGVMMVAKCNVVGVTPGTPTLSSRLRCSITAAMSPSPRS